MNDFLNPKSMLTPGVAGSLMMFLVNGIGFQFPELPMRYTALVLSFLIGSVVWFSEIKGRAPMVQKGVYWILNSLVIFVVGFGTANLAADASTETTFNLPPRSLELLAPASAYADQSNPATDGGSAVLPQAQQQGLIASLGQEQTRNQGVQQDMGATQSDPDPSPDSPEPEQPQKPFFKRW